MARSSWTIEKLVGISYVSDGSIYRPNESVTFEMTATQKRVALANGDSAFVTPETKYVKEPLTFTWLLIPESDGLKSKIENYVINQDYLRITNHLGEYYIGRFTQVRKLFLVGEEDTYEIEATFERMEN
jgi:hypothetical protein